MAREQVIQYKKVVYLSGPMTGLPDYNRAEFAHAQRELERRGFQVINPHLLPDPPLRSDDEKHNWCVYLARDLHEIVKRHAYREIDCIALLPGWHKSRGAMLESLLADRLRVPSFDWEFICNSMKPYSDTDDSVRHDEMPDREMF